MGQILPLFVTFHPFLNTMRKFCNKSVNCVLLIQTRNRTMVGADKSAQLYRAHIFVFLK